MCQGGRPNTHLVPIGHRVYLQNGQTHMVKVPQQRPGIFGRGPDENLNIKRYLSMKTESEELFGNGKPDLDEHGSKWIFEDAGDGHVYIRFARTRDGRPSVGKEYQEIPRPYLVDQGKTENGRGEYVSMIDTKSKGTKWKVLTPEMDGRSGGGWVRFQSSISGGYLGLSCSDAKDEEGHAYVFVEPNVWACTRWFIRRVAVDTPPPSGSPSSA